MTGESLLQKSNVTLLLEGATPDANLSPAGGAKPSFSGLPRDKQMASHT